MDKTIFVIRRDQNEGYDLKQAADYIARLKKEDKSIVLMQKEVSMADNTSHYELIGAKANEVKELRSQGFNEI
jgi:hypothetical protein